MMQIGNRPDIQQKNEDWSAALDRTENHRTTAAWQCRPGGQGPAGIRIMLPSCRLIWNNQFRAVIQLKGEPIPANLVSR
jgi:hypothetical protein